METSQLIVSKKAVDAIINFEITSQEYYKAHYSFPTWPGLQSGITIGIGWDLGYNTAIEVQDDWEEVMDQKSINRLKRFAGVTGIKAKESIVLVRDIDIPYQSAEWVFENKTLQKSARELVHTYPTVEELNPDTCGALLSLIYNRGSALAGARRREMAAIKPLVLAKDYAGVASQIRGMKHYWDGVKDADTVNEKRARGLVIRREEEATLCELKREYTPMDLITITF